MSTRPADRGLVPDREGPLMDTPRRCLPGLQLSCPSIQIETEITRPVIVAGKWIFIHFDTKGDEEDEGDERWCLKSSFLGRR
jgi:hypothetical protein